MLAARIIEPGTLERSRDRVTISVRMPWYRALPLSSLTDLALDIDGVAATPGSLTWTVDGVTYTPEELTSRWDHSWYVLDSALLSGMFPELPERDAHEVHVFIGLHIPYLPNGAGRVLKIGEQDTKTMALKELAA